ncbi:LAME_0E12222g1_1 [Lachancea meyersii CBS 8951]|uniref:DNA helicase n=1 Tax=Lachancea meyersii CBS 8951 TaxID=1266667 RepID=A0A1G4JLY3_9SACH|nr:LAME_0E12222g1_1 [Lachancea meyersii CBS 8951]
MYIETALTGRYQVLVRLTILFLPSGRALRSILFICDHHTLNDDVQFLHGKQHNLENKSEPRQDSSVVSASLTPGSSIKTGEYTRMVSEHNQASLEDLGIELVYQNALENQIETSAQSAIDQQTLDQELKRLERAQNALDKAVRKRELLKRKLNNATRISVRQKLQVQLQALSTDEIRPLQNDVNDIKSRVASLSATKSSQTAYGDPTARQPTESEEDYQIRIGQKTAFGTKSEFLLEKNVDLDNPGEGVEDDGTHMESSGEDAEVVNSDSDYHAFDEDHLEEESTRRNTGMIDDGDELSYQRRLKRWIRERSRRRHDDQNPATEEYLKSHPEHHDAKLNGDFKIPGEIFDLLFNYQKTCVQWLYELYQQECGGIIGDEMGLGKTIQMIAFLASLHHSNKLDGPVIIVCPATVLRQWCKELHTWWPAFRTVILHSIGSGMTQKDTLTEEQLEELVMNSNPDEVSFDAYKERKKVKSSIESGRARDALIEKVVTKGHVLITTYVGLRVYSDKLLNIKWSYAVLDEGHKIRNPDADISLTCKQLKTRNRIILSGTPIQNNLTELWSLFDFIYPGRLGTLPVFQQQFSVPINMGGYANATNVQVQTGYKCAIALRNLISPYLLRRIKADVAKDLPQKNEMVLFCKLTKYQRDKYVQFLNSEDLVKIRNGKRQVLFGIDILRKICNHPDMLVKNERQHELSYGDPRRSGKMQVVKQLLKLWHGQKYKTLLFAQTRQMLDILEKFLSKDAELAELNYLRMDGATSIGSRQALVYSFNKGPYDVFLLTTRVGGLGVNLTGANRIIIFDPDWNPSTDMQARERAWRIGQKREVSIYRLMIAGSIEEKIYHRQIFKQFLTNKILTDPKQKRFFKMNELQDLFTLGGDSGLSNETLENEVQKETANLKNSKTEEGDDFEEVVQLSGVSKLEGFFSAKDKEEGSRNEDDRLMDVLSGGNVEGAKSHASVVEFHSRPSDDIISKEATRIAEDAVAALRKSRKVTKNFEVGTPTWTGKFGTAGRVKKKKAVGTSLGSAAILSNLRKKEQVNEENFTDKRREEAAKTMEGIRSFFLTKPAFAAKSVEIVEHMGIKLTAKEDIIKIRALLKQIATFQPTDGRWTLKDDLAPAS